MAPPLAIPDYPFRAYLFDCDGTIAHSMPVHYRAWMQTLGAHACPFPEAQFYAWAGRPGTEIVRALNAEHGLAMSPAAIETEKEARYLELLPEVEGIPGVLAHIAATHGRLPFAVVSGGPRDTVERIVPRDALELVRTGLADLRVFGARFGMYEVEQGGALGTQRTAVHRMIRIALDMQHRRLGVLRVVA